MLGDTGCREALVKGDRKGVREPRERRVPAVRGGGGEDGQQLQCTAPGDFPDARETWGGIITQETGQADHKVQPQRPTALAGPGGMDQCPAAGALPVPGE